MVSRIIFVFLLNLVFFLGPFRTFLSTPITSSTTTTVSYCYHSYGHTVECLERFEAHRCRFIKGVIFNNHILASILCDIYLILGLYRTSCLNFKVTKHFTRKDSSLCLYRRLGLSNPSHLHSSQ